MRGLLILVGFLLFGAVVFQQGYLGKWLREMPFFSLRQIDLRITPELPGLPAREEFLRVAGLDAVHNLLEIDMEFVRKRLLTIPGVKTVQIRRNFPDSLEVDLTLFLPRAILSLENLYYVDDEGTIFKMLSPADSKDFPIITGLTRAFLAMEPQPSREGIVLALALLDEIPVDDVSEIHLQSVFSREFVKDQADLPVFDQGFWDITLFLTQSATEVRLGVGGLPEMTKRLARLALFLSRSGEPLDNLLRLDLRFSDQVVANLRNS